MPAKQQEVTAVYHGTRHTFAASGGNTIIADASIVGVDGSLRTTQIKGFVANGEELRQSQSYRLWGRWTEYRGTPQFQFATFAVATPHSRAGIVGYLDGAPGIGPALAARLFDIFKSKAVDVLRDSPELAADKCSRLPVGDARKASLWLRARKATEDALIDTMELLDGRGFRKSTAKSVVGVFGSRAPEIVRRNPYVLRMFPGVGFKLCDKLYLDLGGRRDKLKRQAACVAHAIESDTSGNTWHYHAVADASLHDNVGDGVANVGKAVRLANRAKLISCQWTNGIDGSPSWDGDSLWLAEQRKARNERKLAAMIAAGMLADPWPDAPLFGPNTVSDHQSEQLIRATSHGAIGILGGSPGTGKTFAAAHYIKLLADSHGIGQIAVCAPTGKAAVRISESMASHGIPIVAKTIHSLLRVKQQDGGGWSFEHCEKSPLPFRFVFVDESSMIDTDLAASLLSARGRDTRILFVGDVNQLPPVGHGAPLRDMITAGVPYGELTEIRRNSGGIVKACADIRDGKRFECEGNLHIQPCRTPEVSIDAMLWLLRSEDDPVWGCQVLVAVNKKSGLSRREVNAILQQQLNPNPAVKGSPFRYGDKVVNTKNGFYPPAINSFSANDDATRSENGDIYVANGEIGCVERVEPKFIEVRLLSPDRLIRVPRSNDCSDDSDDAAPGTGCDWDLAYALSVHKSQGSEWPAVIVLIDEYPGARRLCDRAWLYTAISRAKQRCYLVGNLETAQRFCRVNNIAKRKTFLAELIEQEVTKQSAEYRDVPESAGCEFVKECFQCQLAPQPLALQHQQPA